jgi:hypothetical protein
MPWCLLSVVSSNIHCTAASKASRTDTSRQNTIALTADEAGELFHAGNELARNSERLCLTCSTYASRATLLRIEASSTWRAAALQQ